MHVVEHGSAAEFLDRTEAFRAAEPVLTNIIGSVATSVVSGRRYEAELWLSVHEEAAGVPVGIAIRTAPYNLAVSPMPLAAAHALGERLAEIDPALPGVSGPREIGAAVIAGFAGGLEAHVEMDNKVRVLTELRTPRDPVPGRARRVHAGDLDLVTEWMLAFGAEADLHVQPSRDDMRADLQAADAPAMWLWEVGTKPVSLGGHAALVHTPGGTVGRIGPIYTPLSQRGRGYGSAITHAIAQVLRDQCQIVMLFTDASNATSNSVYARLGFDVVADWVEFTLAPGSAEVTTRASS